MTGLLQLFVFRCTARTVDLAITRFARTMSESASKGAERWERGRERRGVTRRTRSKKSEDAEAFSASSHGSPIAIRGNKVSRRDAETQRKKGAGQELFARAFLLCVSASLREPFLFLGRAPLRCRKPDRDQKV
jgi:hypothetical protein